MSDLNRFRAFSFSGASLGAFFLVIATAVLLAGCGADQIVPPCPPVRIDNATSSLVKFRDGGGTELPDMEYRAEVVGYKGQCVFTKKKKEITGVKVVMDIDFAIEPGPAAKREPVTLYYFVAIPQYFPQTEGKKVMVIHSEVSGPREKPIHIHETQVHAFIPLKKDEAAASYDVYVGLQLNTAQLAYNRAHPR